MRNIFNLRRQIILVFALALGLALGIGFAGATSVVSLKHNSLIEGNVITLGHIFSGLERKGEKVLGPAPQPGHDMVLNARTLMRIAVAMDLPWRPVSTADQVVLSRAATVIPKDMVMDRLKEALKAQGVRGHFDLAILAGSNDIILPFGSAQSVKIDHVRFSKDQNRFDASVIAPAQGQAIVRENISGTIQRLAQVPILNRTFKTGNVIARNDIDFIHLRTNALKHNIVLSEDELIGMTPRRIILAGEPIRDNEIQAPQIVERGELVTMVFDRGGLSLTAQGKALQSGAKGDVIRVVNASSSKTLQATITGQKEVAVSGF